MSRLVMAAFWTDDDDSDVLREVGDAIEAVSLEGSGGVSILADPPDLALRRVLRSIPGLESAADA